MSKTEYQIYIQLLLFGPIRIIRDNTGLVLGGGRVLHRVSRPEQELDTGQVAPGTGHAQGRGSKLVPPALITFGLQQGLHH